MHPKPHPSDMLLPVKRYAKLANRGLTLMVQPPAGRLQSVGASVDDIHY